MGGVLVQGASLGAAFELLFISVIDATQRVACFSSDFNRLQSMLCSIKLVIHDVENFNRILERPHHETQIFTDRLLEGEKLIRRCSNVKWNVLKRLYYSRKLSNLESLLVSFFQINVAALHFRESKRISVVVEQQMKEITSLRVDFKEKFNELTSIVKKNQICGYCNSKNDVCIPMIVDGFEHSSQVKKEGMLLENSGENTVNNIMC